MKWHSASRYKRNIKVIKAGISGSQICPLCVCEKMQEIFLPLPGLAELPLRATGRRNIITVNLNFFNINRRYGGQ